MEKGTKLFESQVVWLVQCIQNFVKHALSAWPYHKN